MCMSHTQRSFDKGEGGTTYAFRALVVEMPMRLALPQRALGFNKAGVRVDALVQIRQGITHRFEGRKQCV